MGYFKSKRGLFPHVRAYLHKKQEGLTKKRIRIAGRGEKYMNIVSFSDVSNGNQFDNAKIYIDSQVHNNALIYAPQSKEWPMRAMHMRTGFPVFKCFTEKSQL